MENKIYKDTLITEKGYEAANKAANGQASFTITRVVASENQYKGKSNEELRQLTSLDNEIDGQILDQNNVNTKLTAIKTNFSNEIKTSGYVANTVGFYAKYPNGNEFLYSVTPSENGQIVPAQSTNVFSGFELIVYVLVGNVQKMDVNLSPGGDATIDYVNKVVSQASDKILSDIKVELDKTYQNAVTTAKIYTDNSSPYTMTPNEAEAIRQANAAVRPGLFLYPTEEDKSKVSVYKHVLGVYSYGIGNIPTVALDLTNLDSSKFTFNNVYVLYNPNNKKLELHGSITVKNVTSKTDAFSLNIGDLGMNDINIQFLNNQAFTIDTGLNRKNIIGTVSSNATINLEGCWIYIKYDGTLKQKVPSWVPDNAIIVTSGNLNDYYSKREIYYAPAGNTMTNTPANSPYAFRMSSPVFKNKSGDGFLFSGFPNFSGTNAIMVKYDVTNDYRWRDTGVWNEIYGNWTDNFKNKF